MLGNPVHSWGNTPYHQQSSFVNSAGRRGGHTDIEPFLYKVARGMDRNGQLLGFNERLNSALTFNDYVAKNPHQNWPELISPPNYTMRTSPLCLAVENANLPMVIVLLSLGADLDISPMCSNKTPLNRSNNYSSPESDAIKLFMTWVADNRAFISGYLEPYTSEQLRDLILTYSQDIQDLPKNTTARKSNANLLRARLFKGGSRRRKNRKTRRAV